MRKLIGLFVFLLLVGMQFSVAQERKVTGTVTDAGDGSYLPGVTVVVKGQSANGTATNIDGKYELKVPANAILVFSFVGMKTQEIAVGNMSVINVKLESESKRMDEVVVTAMGIKRAERSLGYGVAKVDADEGVQKAEPDLLRALDGKIAGVNISAPSGVAGSATKITIRGNSSFLGNNEPLYVVDGVPYSNPEVASSNQATESGGAYGSGLSTLDPNDIETMSVLKGAAASALYGSRAANGVVLITTKSGSKKTNARKGLEVTLSGSYTIETIANLPDYQNSFGTGTNFKAAGSNGSWGAAFSDVTEVPIGMYGGNYKKYYPNLPDMIPYKAYKDNVKDLFRTGGIYEGALNISSVGENGNFNTTISRLKQDSYIPNSDFERYSISVGGNYKLLNGIRAGGNLSFSRALQSGPMFGGNPQGGIAVSSFARTMILGRNWDMSLPYETPEGASLFFLSPDQADNPLWSWKNNTINTTMDRTVANVTLGYDIFDWLSVDYTLGINDYKMDRKEVVNLGSKGLGGKGRILTNTYDTQELEGTLLIGINKNITPDVGFKATIGHNFNQLTTKENKVDGRNIMSAGVYNINNTESQTAEEYYSRRGLWALFADVMFDYKQYLFLNVTGRNDWSSTLPTNNRSFFYPAVMASFVFTEGFGISNKTLNFGKIRASWAKVGNDASPYYKNGSFLLGSPYNGQPIMSLRDVKFDPNLKPEFTSEIEFGLDLQMFDSRVNVDFSYYNRNTTDQIAPLSLPNSTGYTSYYTNFGKMNNHGIEIGLDLTPVIVRDFKWNLYGTLSKNWSEVKELVNGVDQISVGGSFDHPKPVLMKGKPYGMLRGSVLARDEKGNRLIDPKSGMYLISNEEGFIGDPNPDLKMSVANTLSYKGLSLNFMFDFQFGGCVYSQYMNDLLGRGVTKDTEDRWGTRILPGYLGDPATQKPLLDDNGNKIVNTKQLTEMDMWFGTGTLSAFAINSADEVSVYDATTFRLRELTLAYDFPKSLLAKTFIGGINVSFVARNLWTYSPNIPKYCNYDPTAANTYGGSNVQGIDYTTAPSTRRYGFNLKLTF